jgi:hypothetical protein
MSLFNIPFKMEMATRGVIIKAEHDFVLTLGIFFLVVLRSVQAQNDLLT